MDSFPEALDYVHTALRQLHARGVACTASRDALATLVEALALPEPVRAAAPAPRAVEPPPATPAPPPVAVETSLAQRIAPTAAAPSTRVLPPMPTLPRRSTPLPPRAAIPVITPAVLPTPAAGSKAERLTALREPVLGCVKCPHLVRSRTQVVFGVGNAEAELMFVGEAPGEDEDRRGEPFIGRAGQLLTKIITAMGFQRETIYIANVLKCRPDMPAGTPGNRKPTSQEMGTCLPYLEQQIEIIQPRILVGLGLTAMQGLLGTTSPMNKLRGQWHEFRGIPLMATYHPSYLLRPQPNQLADKRKTWEDMLLVLEKLGRPISEKQQKYFLSKE